MSHKVLVLGAGQSSPCLIEHFKTQADLQLTVADRDLASAQAAVGNGPGQSVQLDATDTTTLAKFVEKADIVVNLLTPHFQAPVAHVCLEKKRTMVSASYRSKALRALDKAAREADVCLLSEIGLDPGLDHMSSMRLLENLRSEGYGVESFDSYGAGIADPDTISNPFGYVITWNPRNVVMAGEAGARYRDEQQTRLVAYPEMFCRTWMVPIEGVGTLEAYANRDAVSYRALYGLEGAHRIVRATMRTPGFCEAWSIVARLGLANERLHVEDLPNWTWSQLVESFLPWTSTNPRSVDLPDRVASHLGVHPTSKAMDALRWLGLFSSSPIGALSHSAERVRTPAEALVTLVQERLRVPEGGRDWVILHHEVKARRKDAVRVATSTLSLKGEPGGTSAMAKTVGLPMAVATTALLRGEVSMTGCPIPVESTLIEAVLPELETLGLTFKESFRDSSPDTDSPR